MPVDKFGFPFQYASKPGGFFYEMEDNPENSNFADWPSEMSFPGNGTVTMEPQGATDFGLGKNIASFSDAIGGCSMSFADTVARGYMYRADDPRDLEIKCIFGCDGTDSGFDMSISSRTGHHTGDGCCQGFAYMLGVDMNTNPMTFRFRKEMWHVSYHESPEGTWTHPTFNFKLDGHAPIGFGLTIYNKPGSNNTRVVLEAWGNPNPVANPTNWIMLKRIEDFSGNGWGDDGGDCDGEDDQYGPWSGPQSRFKTNSGSGTLTFKAVSMREIDPTRALDDTSPPPPPPPGSPPPPPSPTPPPPPPPGSPTPSTISPIITYMMVSIKSTPTDNTPPISPLDQATRAIAVRMAVAMVDPDTHARFGPAGWRRDLTTGQEISGLPCTQNINTTSTSDTKSYADGLTVQSYWSNSANLCVMPGLASGAAGTDTNDVTNHGGRILKNPHIHLIFWNSRFTDWNSRTEAPTKDQIISEIRDKLLGTDKQYFSGLQQYGNPGIPVWGASGTGSGGSPPSPPPPPPASGNELVMALPRYRNIDDSRSIIGLQMRQPNNQWSNTILFNFDTGASNPTDLPLQLLSAFGVGVNGNESRPTQNITIRIPGLNGEYVIPVMTQNKDHYDLLRAEPAPIRYPLLRIRDLLQYMSFVISKDNIIIRTASQSIPELVPAGKIVLPNMTSRAGTPTTAWHWMHVDFINPTNAGDTIDDWFGLNTGDQRIIIKEESVAQDINLTLNPPVDGDPDEHSILTNIRFKEATPSTLVTNIGAVSRTESADFGRGGIPRNFGGGFSILNKYKICLHGSSLQWELIPITTTTTQLSEVLPFAAVTCLTNDATALGVTNLQLTTIILSEELIEAQTDPDVGQTLFNPTTGWWGTPLESSDIVREVGDLPCDLSGTGATGFKGTYADGLAVQAYWSNSHANCIIPGITATDLGNSTALTYHGGRVLQNPRLHLIFWGTEWSTQTNPTMAQVITEVQTKFLGTDVTFFSQLNQYSGVGAPTNGSTCQNTITAFLPDGTDNVSRIAAVVRDSINAGLLPLPTTSAALLNEIYAVFLPKNKGIYQGGNLLAGVHAAFKPSFTTQHDISRPLAYCAISLITTKATAASVTNLQWTDMMLSEELIEAQTDPEGTGWYGDTLEDPLEEPIREIGDNPCDLDTGSFKGTYASGLSVMAYWSNSHANCIIPGITANDIGDSTAITFHGGRVIKNPVLRLIFWGTEWTTQTSPSKAEIITEVQTKLLVTNATFFSQLSQYSSCGTPVYGSAVQNTNVPYPTAGDHSSDRAAIEAVIKDSLNTGLLQVTTTTAMQNELYIVFLAKNKTITLDNGVAVDGYHSTFRGSFT